MLRKVDGAEILRRVEQHGVTVMCAAPAVAAAVLDAAQTWDGEIPGRDRVRIIMAGAPPPTRTVVRVQRSSAGSSCRSTASPRPRRCSPSTGTRAEWDDLCRRTARRSWCAAGARRWASRCAPTRRRGAGALNVILTGYWERPDETDKALVDGWFHTGDGGVIGDDGYLTISDRKKDVIITGGENVSSIEVEDVLFSHPRSPRSR